jgi:hypothetical protein
VKSESADRAEKTLREVLRALDQARGTNDPTMEDRYLSMAMDYCLGVEDILADRRRFLRSASKVTRQ